MIVFLDADEVCVYQESYDNSGFIVEQEGEYYVNEETFLEIMDLASIAPIVRREIYHIGDAVEIHGAGETMSIVKITSFEAIETGDVTTYTIKYSVSSNSIRNEYKSFDFFHSVETKDGVSASASDNVFDFVGTDTVVVEVPKSRKLDAIVLTSPDYPGLLTYRIVMD